MNFAGVLELASRRSLTTTHVERAHRCDAPCEVEDARLATEAREPVQKREQSLLQNVLEVRVSWAKDHAKRRQECGRDGHKQNSLGLDIPAMRMAGDFRKRINRHLVRAQPQQEPRVSQLRLPWGAPHH
jgi:hypothetical protein